MQPDRPYQMIEVLGSCQVGIVWSAVDVQGRSLTVAVLSAAASADQRWRDAFAAAANALGQPQSGGPHFLYADFTAATPWVACAADGGPGAERVFLALGQEYQPVPPDSGDSVGPVTTVHSGATAGASPTSAATSPDGDAEVTQRMPAVGTRPAVGTNPWAGAPPVSPAAPVSPQPAGPLPVSPQPAGPQPAGPQPVSPQPARPQPAGPPHSARTPPQAAPTSPSPMSPASGSLSTPARAIPHPVSPAPPARADAGPDSRLPVVAERPPGRPVIPAIDDAPGWRPRIIPSSPPPRRPPLVALVIGLVVGILAAGAGGYLIGANTVQEPGTPTASTSGQPPADSLAPYQAAQQELNRAKFTGDLAPLAEPWLPWIGGCATNNDPGGPQLPADEQVHVFCRYGGLSVHFAQFRSPDERTAARTYRQRLNLEANELAPGLEPPGRKQGGVTKVAGSYVEYAFRGGDERTICGLWWDRDDGGAALYLETLCEEGLGGRWEPLRDLWQRHS